MKFSLILAFAVCGFLHAGAQNLGIGTPNPTRAKLELHGALDLTSAIFGGDGHGMSLQRSSPGVGFNSFYNGGNRYISDGYGATQVLNPANGMMSFYMFGYGTSGNYATTVRRALELSRDGRVVFGTTAGKGGTMNVGKNEVNNPTASFAGTSHHSHFHFGFEEHTYIRAGKDGGTVFINDIPGAKTVLRGPVGIGTATPAGSLEIRMAEDNKGLLLSEPFHGYTWGLSVRSADPDLSLASNGVYRGYFDRSDASYHHLSDRRLKTAIQPISSVLSKLLKLEAVTYQMKDHDATQQTNTGFLAQNVAMVFPNVVSIQDGAVKGYTGIEDLHMVNYRSFGVLVIQAIKEQQAILKNQAATIRTLESELAVLEASF